MTFQTLKTRLLTFLNFTADDIILLQKSERLFKRGQIKNAIVILTRLIRKYPNDDYLRNRRGNYRIALGLYKSGIQDLNAVSSGSIKDALIYLRRGYGYFMLGENEKAIKDIKIVLKQDPNNVEALSYYGLILLTEYDFRKALKSFDKILDKESDNSIAKIYGGYCNYVLGRNNTKSEYFKKILNEKKVKPLKQGMFFDAQGKFHFKATLSEKELKTLAKFAFSKESR